MKRTICALALALAAGSALAETSSHGFTVTPECSIAGGENVALTFEKSNGNLVDSHREYAQVLVSNNTVDTYQIDIAHSSLLAEYEEKVEVHIYANEDGKEAGNGRGGEKVVDAVPLKDFSGITINKAELEALGLDINHAVNLGVALHVGEDFDKSEFPTGDHSVDLTYVQHCAG